LTASEHGDQPNIGLPYRLHTKVGKGRGHRKPERMATDEALNFSLRVSCILNNQDTCMYEVTLKGLWGFYQDFAKN